MEIFTSRDARNLLNNKFVVIIGDSIQRGVYKDLIHFINSDDYVSEDSLRTKGEVSFMGDKLVEGGQFEDMNNRTTYREVRHYQTPFHMVRFYFVTRCYSEYLETILLDLSKPPAPDVVIMNSCLWDITRYGPRSREEYKKNLLRLCRGLRGTLPPTSLFLWNTTMPIAEKIRGGFLVDQIRFMEDVIRLDAMEANFYASQVMDFFKFDVLDLHYYFRDMLNHRKRDGVHWDNVVNRRVVNLILAHVSEAWGQPLPRRTFSTALDKNNNNAVSHGLLHKGVEPLMLRPVKPVNVFRRGVRRGRVAHNVAQRRNVHHNVMHNAHNEFAYDERHNEFANASNEFAHNDFGSGDGHNEFAFDLQNKFGSDNVHKEFACDDVHSEFGFNEFSNYHVRNEFESEIVHDEFADDVVHNNFELEVVHNEFESEVTHNEFESEVTHNEFESEVTHNEFADDVVHNNFESDHFAYDVNNDDYHMHNDVAQFNVNDHFVHPGRLSHHIMRNVHHRGGVRNHVQRGVRHHVIRNNVQRGVVRRGVRGHTLSNTVHEKVDFFGNLRAAKESTMNRERREHSRHHSAPTPQSLLQPDYCQPGVVNMVFGGGDYGRRGGARPMPRTTRYRPY